MLRLSFAPTLASCWLALLGISACMSHLDLGNDLQSGVAAPSMPDAGLDASSPSDGGDASSTPDAGAPASGPTCVGIPCFAGPPQVLTTSLGSAKGLALDADYVFWAATAGQALMITPKDGSETMRNSTPTAGPFRVAINDTNVYFTSTAGGYVATAPKTAAGRLSPRNPPPITVLASGEAEPQSLVVASEGVYFTDNQAGTLRRVALDGSVVQTIVSGLSAGTELALDASSVYYTDSAAGELHAVDRLSLADTRLAQGFTRPVAPVVRADTLYFLELGDGTDTGRLLGMPRGGGPVQVVADHLLSPTGLAADTAALYVCTRGDTQSGSSGQILRFADDGQINVLADDQAEPFAVAVDGDGVFWTTDADSSLHSIAR
jgi:hypothetical protein